MLFHPKWVNDVNSDNTNNDDDDDENDNDNDNDVGAAIENIHFCDGSKSPSTVSSVLPTVNAKKNKNMIMNKNTDVLEFRGGLREPDCINGWCRSTSPDRVKWKGPAGSDTQWIDATGKTHAFVGRSNKVEEL